MLQNCTFRCQGRTCVIVSGWLSGYRLSLWSRLRDFFQGEFIFWKKNGITRQIWHLTSTNLICTVDTWLSEYFWCNTEYHLSTHRFMHSMGLFWPYMYVRFEACTAAWVNWEFPSVKAVSIGQKLNVVLHTLYGASTLPHYYHISRYCNSIT